MIQSLVFEKKKKRKKSKAKNNAVLIYVEKTKIQLGMTRSKN